MPIKAFFFDLDGTLIDSENVWTESMVAALTRKGVNITFQEIVDFGYGRSWTDIFDILVKRWPDIYKDVDDMCEDFRPYYERIWAERDISFPDALHMVRQLHDHGYFTAIVTGSRRLRAKQVCEKYHLDVDLIVGMEDYQHGKPSPEPYLTAARLGCFKPAECVVVEDAPVGIASGKAAGMKTIAVKRAGALNNFQNADWIFDDLSQFKLEDL